MGELFTGEAAATGSGRYARVALEQGIDAAAEGLTYRVPVELDDLAVGDRVVVPLGRADKPVPGYVLHRDDAPAVDPSRIKPIRGRDPAHLSLPGDLVQLARWISAYYCCPIGMVFATMLPAAVKHGAGMIRRTMVRAIGDATEAGRLSKLQRAVLEEARRRAEAGAPWAGARDLADVVGARSLSPVHTLIEKGLLCSRVDEAIESDLDLAASREPLPGKVLQLTPAQARALDALEAARPEGFGVHLLHGVTGSGKTEVYLRLIERLRGNDGDGAIVLVPEIALTPQTVARFLQYFDGVAVLHSGLSPAQRHAQWRRIRAGEARIVVGARSAVFAPVPRLRLIVVDEEHDPSYKQDQLPRYHARDVAIRRAQLCDAMAVLGSATPSLESYYNARTRPRYHLHALPERPPGMRLPGVRLVDLREQRRQRKGIHLLSRELELAMRQALQQPADEPGGRVLLLLNRRGYANYIACPDHRCGWMLACSFCDATMVYHKDRRLPTGGVVKCHHCEAEQLLPQTCPNCGNKVTVFGLGVQRVEEELSRKFESLRVIRMDSDTMRSGGDYRTSLDAFRRGEADVLLGTQMIAKGLDFPSVSLVGIVCADTSLHFPDFRAAERTFQLVAQVSGRSGRSDRPGHVIVQTFSPDDPVIGLAAGHDYTGFAERELEVRRAVGLPPVTRMARIVVRDKDHAACVERACELAARLRAFNDELGLQVRVRGAAPAPIGRIAGYHRQQIELIGADAARLQKLLTALRNQRMLTSDLHTAVDVDPVSLL